MENKKRPWDRLEKETPNAFLAFRNFLDLIPPRKKKNLIGVNNWNYQMILNWSCENKWNDRSGAYDEWIASERDKKAIDGTKDFISVNESLLRNVVSLINQCVDVLNTEEKIKEVGFRDVAALMRAYASLFHIAKDFKPTIGESLDYDSLSDDDLIELNKICEKMQCS
jgi:hypothetical protein